MNMLRDARLIVRSLRRSPAYAVASIVTLALAIGANTAMFAAVYHVLLAPLPIRDPGGLVVAWKTDPARDLAVVEATFRDYERWSASSRAFSQMAAMGSSSWPVVLDDDAGAVKVASMAVTATFFDTLGAAPLLGRALHAADDQPDARPVAVLSHDFWVARFGARPSIVGETLRVASEPMEIVGVMPPGFDFPRGTAFWTSVVPVLAGSGKTWRSDAFEHVGVLFVVGRLKTGVAAASASQELDAIARREPDAPSTPPGTPTVVVTPFQDYVLGPVRGALWWLFASVGVLLLIACANVSGLMLTRAALRRREQVIRVALGATTIAIARSWIIESLMLAIVGGAFGLAAARWMMSAIVAFAPPEVPRLASISFDAPVALFTVAAVVLTTLLCGLGPMLQRHAGGVLTGLNDAARGSTGARLLRARSALATLQIALAVTLLISAGLVVRSVSALRRVDLGFDPSGVVTMDIQPRVDRPSPNESIADLLARIEQLPHVRAAGAIFLRPLALGAIGQETLVRLEGQPDTPAARQRNPVLSYQVATPSYFRAMRIPLVRGRLFDAHDDARSARVAILGESAAARLFPGRDPIGRRLAMPSFAPQRNDDVWRTVVGVVGDVRYRGLDDVRLDVYDVARQAEQIAGQVVVRTDGDAIATAAAVQAMARQRVRAVIGGVTTMDAVVGRAMAPWRFSMWMFSLFAIAAFVLATVGLAGVASLDVVHRSREFAVRLAVGADRSDILARVLRSAATRLLVGTSLGLTVAIAASRGLRSVLFDVDPLDVTTYVSVIAVVTFVVAAASYVPARRAANIDPAVLLKKE
jgi:predicted permease